MPIDVVVNGYFRSGTTFVWDYLNSELMRENYLSLYEPFHSNLATLVLEEKKEKIINKLHNKYLFQDYYRIPEQKLFELLRNNPNANSFGINNDLEIKNYLYIIDSLPQKVFIQANRLHFHLDILFRDYTNKVVHIVRHPLDVWNSIVKAYGKDSINESYVKKFLRLLMKPWRLKYSFEIEKNYNWIIYKTGYPYNFRDSLATRVLNSYNVFEKFVVVWTVSNYYALHSIRKYSGLLIVYESIIENPIKFQKDINSFLNVKIKDIPNVKKGNFYKFKDKDLKRFLKAIKKYKLHNEFEYILSEIDKVFKWKI